MLYFELSSHIAKALSHSYEEREAGHLARLVLGKASSLEATPLLLANRTEVPAEIEAYALDLLQKLVDGQPWQYITGEAIFCGHTFAVGPGVLIPRPETEMLVETAIQYGDTLGRPATVLDACTGSGCIAHSIALARPSWQVSGFDISRAALAYAYKNKALLGSTATIFEADLLGDTAAIAPPNSIDILVSNPPYIPAEEAPTLSKHVRDFEPAIALFAPEGDALVFYRALERLCQWAMVKDGQAFFEIHSELSIASKYVFEKWTTSAISDSFGKPRMIAIRHRL
jgi:release factor glutamine methyltransferase